MRSRRALLAFSLISGAISLLGLIVLSPVIIGRIFGNSGDWSRLSNIGQAYGSISAILSALALLGVAYATVVQARQSNMTRIQLFREVHTGLLRMAMEDPAVYGPALGNFDLSDETSVKQRLYDVLLLNYFWAMFETGHTSEQGLRVDLLQPVFAGETARNFWSTVRHVWHFNLCDTRRGREFLRIVDEEYSKAAARPALPELPLGPRRGTELRERTTTESSTAPALMLGAAVGFAGYALFARRRRRQ